MYPLEFSINFQVAVSVIIQKGKARCNRIPGDLASYLHMNFPIYCSQLITRRRISSLRTLLVPIPEPVLFHLLPSPLSVANGNPFTTITSFSSLIYKNACKTPGQPTYCPSYLAMLLVV